jgi:hypothetical protein
LPELESFAPLRVVARVRPPRDAGAPACLQQLSATALQATLVEKNKLVRSEVRGAAPRQTTFISTRAFRFDAAFGPRASTGDVFGAEVLPLVERAAAGAHCCVLAYGATGSGKTHSLTGSPGAADAFGIMHMAAVELCDRVAAENEAAAAGAGAAAPPPPPLSIYVTGAEVYQEELLDLGAGRAKRLTTTTLRRVPVASGSPGELVDAVEGFIARRAAGATNKNEHSSRSHAVYTVALERRGEPAGALALVDLAGAEYAAATEGREDVRRLEGGKNNLGLMTLKAAFRHVGAAAARAAGGARGGSGGGPEPPAPFSWHRSKLTAALRPFFTDAMGEMLMLITASPDAADAAQTAQSLEEGVLVAGRALEEKDVREAGPGPENRASFLRAGAGAGGGVRAGVAGVAGAGGAAGVGGAAMAGDGGKEAGAARAAQARAGPVVPLAGRR